MEFFALFKWKDNYERDEKKFQRGICNVYSNNVQSVCCVTCVAKSTEIIVFCGGSSQDV